MLKRNKKNQQNKGFTLIEILLVVGFIALAGIGVYVVYDKVQTSNAVNEEVRKIDTIYAGIKNLYGGSSNYVGLSSSTIKNAKIVPDDMTITTSPGRPPTNLFVNSLGATLNVHPTNYNGGTNNAFNFTYQKMPSSMCTKLVSVAAKNFNQVSINDTIVKDTATQTSLAVDAVAQRCTSSDNKIVFTSL